MIILQTAAEAKAKVKTANLIPLCMSNCRIISAGKESEAYIPQNGVLLFPSKDAVALDTIAETTSTLIVIDSTWTSAQRLLNRSRLLQSLRKAFIPHGILNAPLFKARKAPTAVVKGARSTAEAVAYALDCLHDEKEAQVGAAIRSAVHAASEMQLKFIREKGDGGGRHRIHRVGYEHGLYKMST